MDHAGWKIVRNMLFANALLFFGLALVSFTGTQLNEVSCTGDSLMCEGMKAGLKAGIQQSAHAYGKIFIGLALAMGLVAMWADARSRRTSPAKPEIVLSPTPPQ